MGPIKLTMRVPRENVINQSDCAKEFIPKEKVETVTKTQNTHIKPNRVEFKEEEKSSESVLDTEIPVKTVAKVARKRLMKCTRVFQKHLDNVQEILRWSNATMIRGFDGIGYVCSYCDEQFQKPADLKTHTLACHVGSANTNFVKYRDMNGLTLKLDITDLHCTICSKDIKDLDILMEHLTDEHSITFHKDINNHMLAFKFDNDVLRCFICHNEYHSFKMLINHMSSIHNRNYVCDVCDTGFVNKSSLVTHEKTHETGTFGCSYCDKVFTTYLKQKSHEAHVHIRPKAYKCGLCGESFRLYEQKLRHLVEVHESRLPSIKCSACSKEFSTRRPYMIHIKRDHLQEKKHVCDECGVAFFRPRHLKAHMKKHTGERKFQCDICLKTYGQKSTLREHLRIHADDRKFKCDTCGAAFIQKSTWRAHVRALHKEIV